MLTLTNGPTVVGLFPDLGASIQRFTHGDFDVLRRGRPDTPLDMASFPLVPWTNRISDGVFGWESRIVDVGGSAITGEPHGLHGHGWVWKWEITESTQTTARLRFLHPAGRWPWRYEAALAVSVEPGRLDQTLTVRNLSDEPMPASLGFHPYFERPARLTANVDGHWVGDTVIPSHWEETEAFRGADVDSRSYDTTFTGWDGRAFIETHGARIAVQSDLPNLHVYSPTGRGFFCLEPVGAAPDALNQPERGGEIVPPGQLASASMRISLVGSS